ncbi:MAG: hypothetical protein HN712_28515 [Gemmatimonadetes bacterium]|nr:hypothetical protein [Gemmatimonadota bacterium]MBT6148752.1 hypothetical protein [Gemmatimonadota bacterium]MBT7864288.1 hypothetical protein [Gemmatimonadota bacterium]
MSSLLHTNLRWVLCLALWAPLGAHGQVLRLTEQLTEAIDITAAPGDTITIDVRADLGAQSASGLSFYVRVPRDDFVILGASASSTPAPPFRPGALFEGAVEVRNDVLKASDPTTIDRGWQMMEYAALLGPQLERARSGSGIVASFRLVCPLTPTDCTIAIHQDPIHETRLVLADGLTEKAFLLGAPMSINVDTQTAVAPVSWSQVKVQPK